jgi:hypothetical protein
MVTGESISTGWADLEGMLEGAILLPGTTLRDLHWGISVKIRV